MKDKVLLMKDIIHRQGTSRVEGLELKAKTLHLLREYDRVIFDFNGIDYVSTGFAKDLFGNLYLELKTLFPKKIVIKVGTNKVLKDTIMLAIKSVK